MRRVIVVVSAIAALTVAPAQAEADVTPPESHMSNVPSMTLSARPLFIFSGVDDTDVASYDVRISRTPMTAARRSPWTRPAKFQGIEATRIRPYVGRGHVVCVSVRARDLAGNVEPWDKGRSGYECRSRALDDSRLRREGHIEIDRDKRYWHGSAAVLRPGAHLWLNGIRRGAHVGVLMTALPDETGRVLTWTIPGQPHLGYVGGPRRPLYGEQVDYVNTAKWRGKVVFHWSGERTEPLEGVAIYPRWMELGLDWGAGDESGNW